jgi:hypothetical protein
MNHTSDVERYADLVREYHRQDGTTSEARKQRSRAYWDAFYALQDEIGVKRMETAREEYEKRSFREAEAREDRWIESHYR